MVQRPQRMADIVPGEFTCIYPKMILFLSNQVTHTYTHIISGKRLRNTTPRYEIAGVRPVVLMDTIRKRIRHRMRLFRGNPILFLSF